MRSTLELIHGLPKKELVERIHFHRRQGEIAERALGFYLYDMQKRKQCKPYTRASVWARKHLPGLKNPHRLILLARRLEKLPLIANAFSEGEVPWTKIREIARVAEPETQEKLLHLARTLTSRELERALAGLQAGELPGEGLKCRREKVVESFPLSFLEDLLWQKAVRRVRAVVPEVKTPAAAAVFMARLALSADLEGKSGKKVSPSVLDLVVYHRGPDGKTFVDTEEGRVEVDPAVVGEKVRTGARVIEVDDVGGPAECTAIRFGERGKVPPEDRDAKVTARDRETVFARDGGCRICGCRVFEDLMCHHLDSHGDGGKSVVSRLVALCCRCHGAVHEHGLLLRVENGDLVAYDGDGQVVGKFRTSAEVLGQAGPATPLEVLLTKGDPPAPEEPSPGAGLPREITAAQWRALGDLIAWSPGQRTFVVRREALEEVFEILKARAEAPAPLPAPRPSLPAPRGVRPDSFDDFVGQPRLVVNLRRAARLAREGKGSLGHVLLSGPPGLGKTTVARILARESGRELVETLGGTISDPHHLVSILARLPAGAHLFIDEIHGLEKPCQECLYTALEDGFVSLLLEDGAQTTPLNLRLEPFTLVGATTHRGALAKPFRRRFKHCFALKPYKVEELAQVVLRAAAKLGLQVTPEAALAVARRGRETPAEAIQLLEHARDVAQAASAEVIEAAHVVQTAEELGIDENGLDETEQEAVKLLVARKTPLGVEALAARLGVDRETYREVHEPWLERIGLTERTDRGRFATEEARALYGKRESFGPRGPSRQGLEPLRRSPSPRCASHATGPRS